MGKHLEDPIGRSRTYTFSFAVTRTAPDEVDETVASVLRSFKPVDFMILAALAVVFAIEPFAIYMLLTHYRGPLLADRCPDAGRSVVFASQYPDLEAPGSGLMESDQEVVTPLNVRDPSSLVMGPAVPYALDVPRRPAVSKPSEEERDGGWQSAVSHAVKGGGRTAPQSSDAP